MTTRKRDRCPSCGKKGMGQWANVPEPMRPVATRVCLYCQHREPYMSDVARAALALATAEAARDEIARRTLAWWRHGRTCVADPPACAEHDRLYRRLTELLVRTEDMPALDIVLKERDE